MFVRVCQFIFSKGIGKEWQNNIKIFSIDWKNVKMIRICCTVCNVYSKLKNPKLSNIFGKILGFSIVYSKSGNEYRKNI